MHKLEVYDMKLAFKNGKIDATARKMEATDKKQVVPDRLLEATHRKLKAIEQMLENRTLMAGYSCIDICHFKLKFVNHSEQEDCISCSCVQEAATKKDAVLEGQYREDIQIL